MPQPIPGRARLWGRGPTRSEYFAEPILSICPRPILHAPSQKKLPVELIDEILSYLTARRDICAVLRTSKQFHAIMLPKYWNDVSVYPRIGGEMLSVFEGQLDKPCTPWKSRGEQVERLMLSLRRPNKKVDVHEAYIPVYHLLEKLPNLASLGLHVGQELEVSRPWKRGDIDQRQQLPSLRSLVFTPPEVETRGSMTHPNTRFEKWLFSQEKLKYFEYCAKHKIASKFPPKAFPNLRRLKIASENIRMTRGLAGARDITHLKVTTPYVLPSSFQLPPALSNVTVLARDDNDLELAILFPKLERIDIEYEGLDIEWLLCDLRYDNKSRKGNFQNLRLLRVWGFRVIGTDDLMVGDIFKELAGLESFEVMRDDLTCMRYGRDGTTRVVQWKCDKSEVWYHDWEKDVTTEDPDSPLVFFYESGMWIGPQRV